MSDHANAERPASESEYLDSDDEQLAQTIARDPMYFILSQFLETPEDDNGNSKNITEVLHMIAIELGEIRKLLHRTAR